MADPKGGKAITAADDIDVQAKNAINVAMEDLAEVDRREIEWELEEELAEIRRRKLACFQKSCNDIIKKADTTMTSSTKVNAQLSPEDLVHMVDMSVVSKYGADLTQLMWVVAKDMRSTLDAFK
jgi:hypothetical protein